MDSLKSIPNLQKLESHQQDKYKNVPKEYLKVAEGMEAQFTNHLLNEMRKTVKHSTNSPAERIYRSMLDQERAKMMAETNTGIGIKDTVLREIYPNFNKPNKANLNHYQAINSQKGEKI